MTSNDWSTVDIPALGGWIPQLPVSVVIPSYQSQPSLDLTLASLVRQTYPDDLVEVVVVDDGSRPALGLPDVRPANTRLVRVDGDDEWGAAHACNIGVRQSTGAIVLRLDADMVVHPGHVEAHARWHHAIPHAVTLGAKLFVDVTPGGPGWPEPAEVLTKDFDQLFPASSGREHAYLDRMLAETDDLRAADHLVFLAHTGATVGLRRELFETAGGYDPALRRGEDTELGYRLAQAGALFVPDRQARGWHLGRSGMMRDRAALRRASGPYLANRMPHPRWLREVGGSGWAVPLVRAVLVVADEPFEQVRAAADSVLRGAERDLRLDLVGPWDSVSHSPRRDEDPALAALRLIAETYRSDPRVQLVTAAPSTAFPSPYLLELPAAVGLSRDTISRLVDEADQRRADEVHAGGLVLRRTSAQGRARWLPEVQAARPVQVSDQDLVDLTAVPAETLARAGAAVVRAGSLGWLPAQVEVAGLRSWLRATRLVVALAVNRVRTLARPRRRW